MHCFTSNAGHGSDRLPLPVDQAIVQYIAIYSTPVDSPTDTFVLQKQYETLAGFFQLVKYGAEEKICANGDVADFVALVVSGRYVEAPFPNLTPSPCLPIQD